MAKVIIIMDVDKIPENCTNCPQELESDCSGRAYCVGTGDDPHEIDGDDWNIRPDWCPIITPDYFTYYDTWKNLIDFLEGKCRLGLI